MKFFQLKNIRKLGSPLQLAGIIISFLAIVLFIFIIYLAKTLPSIQEIAAQQITQSTKIYDRTGTALLYEISKNGKRTVAPFNQIPQTLKDATISIEDQNFYNEPAFDLKGILRAILANITSRGIVQGGSTITQQLARNAFLTLDQTFSRKIKELILAIKLNQYYSKDQILGLYLNEVSYGPTTSGVESASEAYFGKAVENIDLAQSAVLAALPQAPTYYSPWGSHVSSLLTRQQTVLKKMYELGKINKKQLDAALAEKIVFQPRSLSGINAPHFVTAVQDYLVQKYGEEMVDNGGLKVITTLDWTLQQEAESAVSAGASQNEKLYNGKNASLVAEDPKTGQILAMVGSRNYFDSKNEGNFNVATQGLRQPGSSLKPFVYLRAFQKGFAPQSILFDVPTEFSTDSSCPSLPDFNSTNTACFHPQNFEGTFVGPISIRNALAQSVNIPAVKMLYMVGLRDTVTNMNSFGLTTLNNPDAYGLSLTLGGGAVHLIDLLKAYSVLAAEGTLHNQKMILTVQDSSGKILESYNDENAQVSDVQSVRLINDILSDSNARSGLFQGSLGLTVFPGHDVALKTGTSNDYRDAWAMGYTPSLVVGVWAGNNNNSPMQKNGSSILAAVPIWSSFMAQALQNASSESFIAPDPVNPSKPILAGNYLIDNQVHSELYYIDKNNPTGADPINPWLDPQFQNWETGLQAWIKRNGI